MVVELYKRCVSFIYAFRALPRNWLFSILTVFVLSGLQALEVVSPEHQVMILRELEGTVQKCVKDQSKLLFFQMSVSDRRQLIRTPNSLLIDANHVIQKIVTTCPPDLLSFVVEAFVGHIYNFATHPYSCRVLQRILENCPERMTRPLLQELKTYALNL